MGNQITPIVLSIPNGGTKSGSVQGVWDSVRAGALACEVADACTIKAPAALTGVVTIQVAMTQPSVDADFDNVQQNGVDLTLAAGKAVTLLALGVRDIRLISTLAEGAQRDFYVALQEEVS